jgi:ABC-type branched-subunit amino acid transport system substrate-binding protein
MPTSLAVALVTPLTGPLAHHGLAAMRAATLWARDEQLPPPCDAINVATYDAHPDPAAAMRAAVAARPAAIFGPYGYRAGLAAFSATDRTVFNIGAPSTRFVRQAFPHVINMAAPGVSWARNLLALLRGADRRVRKVALMVAEGEATLELVSAVRAAAVGLGFEIASSVFAPARANAAARRLPPADVLLVHGSAEDEAIAADVLLRRPWRAAVLSTIASDVPRTMPVGLRDGLIGLRDWSATSATEVATGPSSRAFAEAYLTAYGEMPTTSAATAYAAGAIFGRSVRWSGGADDTSVLAASRGLDTTTLFGRFQLDRATGLQVGHQIALVQWQGDDTRTVWPSEGARASLIYPRWHATPGRSVGG